MEYNIYFDESNKLDSPNKTYSYYGAFGIEEKVVNTIEKDIKEILDTLHSSNELHFNNYQSNKIRKYFQVLDYFLQHKVDINLYIVNNQRFIETGNRLSLSIKELRKYFYVKIPERLFYGIVRHISEIELLSIYMDDNTEYETLNVYNQVKDQMNAHSLYRNKGYIVKEVKGLFSEDSVMVQIIDSFMGIIVFILEKDYLEYSVAKRAKADLIYRLLTENNNVVKFQNMIHLFLWNGENENIDIIYLSSKITEFLIYMNDQDSKNIQKIQEIYLKYNCGKMEFPEKRKLLQEKIPCSNSELQIYLGYAMQVEHGDRNKFIRRSPTI